MEDEEVVSQDSPFAQYLKDIGTDVERVVYEPNVQSSSNDSKSNGHADSSISSSLLILLHDVLMCDQVKHLEIKSLVMSMLDSPVLLEEHHAHLKSYITHMVDHQTESQLGRFGRVVAFLGVAKCLLPHLVPSGDFWCSLTGIAVLVSGATAAAKCYEDLSTIGLSRLLSKIRARVKAMDHSANVWRKCVTFCTEMNLISKSPLIVTRKIKDILENKEHDATVCIRTAMYRNLMDEMGSLKADLSMMQSMMPSLMFGQDHGLSMGSDQIDLSLRSLQNQQKLRYILWSQWIHSVVTCLSSYSITSLDIIGKIQAPLKINNLEKLLLFHKDIADGTFERRRTPRAPSDLFRDGKGGIYSLRLHAQELLRLSKQANDNTTQEQFSKLQDQIKYCQLCLDTAQTERTTPTNNSESVKLVVPVITPQPVALDLTEASPITDQVFVGDTSEKDEVPDDPSEEYPGQSAMVMYEKCLLEELQGVIGELAREREAREQNLTSVTDPEDLARRTRTIIEGRDIDQLIHSQAKTQTDDGNLQLKQQKKERKPKYEYIPEETGQLPGHPINFSQIANAVAKRCTEAQATETTFGSDSESEENSLSD